MMKMVGRFVFVVLLMGTIAQATPKPATFCRFVPERKDDFAWENDKVAFRVYGPALKSANEDSGIDCWLKRVDYPIVNKWYRESETLNKSYHKDHGEGYDGYKVGSSRGCGGLGLWINGELKTSNVFTKWRIVKCTDAKSEFVLTYEWTVGADVYKEEKRISILLGDRLFKVVSTFWKNGSLALKLPVAVGVARHAGAAVVSKDLKRGWVACWELIDGSGLGTAVVMNPTNMKEVVVKKDHVLLITSTDGKGQVCYYAGYGWARAGEIKTLAEWQAYLTQFAMKKFKK
jgi:hypothetical protein